MASKWMNEYEDKDRQSLLLATLSRIVIVVLFGFVAWRAKLDFDDFRGTMAKAVDRIGNHEVRISVIENATGIRASKGEIKEHHLGKN